MRSVDRSTKLPIVPEGWIRSDGPPYSPAIRLGELVFVSGQLPIDPATGQMVGGTVQAQTTRALENLGIVLEHAGASLDDLVKVTVYLLRRSDWPAMNEAYRVHVGKVPPARTAVVVPEMVPGAAVEIDAIAVVRS